MSAAGVSHHPGVLDTQRAKSSSSKLLAPVPLDGVRLVDLTDPTMRSNDVLHDERQAAVEGGLPAPPAEVPTDATPAPGRDT
jgi:hypothetical protein